MRRLKIVALIFLLSTVCTLTFADQANATVTPYISFQGKLTNTDGTNVTDGSYSIVFSIYSVATGGTAVWSETDSVTASGGLFQVNLGQATTLPGSINFNTNSLYLGIKVGSDAEMTPRVQLTSAPQAFDADNLGGISSSGYVQLSPGSQQSGSINISGAITSGAVNGLTLAQAADGFTVSGGTTSRTLTVQGANITIGSTIQPTAAGALAVQSNGANTLGLDTGGAAAVNIGGTNATAINVGNATSNPTIAFNGSGSFGTTTGAVSLNGNVTVASGKSLTIANGSVSETYSASTASTAHSIALTNSNTGAGITLLGVNIAPTNTSTPSSGTNTLNGVNFAAGGALGAGDTTNGINFASSTGYTNYINSPTFILSSAGAISGVTTVSTSGAINGDTVSSSSLTFGSASTATVASAASQALTITGNAASTWSTSAGTLTIQSGSGTVSLGSSTVLSSAGALTINSGAATALTVDGGTTGALNLGTSSNSKTITIGNTTGTTAIATLVGSGNTNAFSIGGPSSAVYFQVDTQNSRIYIGGSTAGSTGILLVLNSKNTTGDPTETDGGMYYNSTNNRFRCGENGAWVNCIGGTMTSNTTASSANNTCTTACAAFSTTGSIPANFCVPGRVIHILANGIFSTTTTAPSFGAWGVYVGSNSTTKTSDTLVGGASPTSSLLSISMANTQWKVDYYLSCDTTGTSGTITGEGTFSFVPSTTTTTSQTVLPMNSSTTTTMNTTTAQTIYLFPAWSASSAGNTATVEQFLVTAQ